MITGGVEKALIAMLKQFDYSKVSVDLYLQKDGGDLISEIPAPVSIETLKTPHFKDFYKYPKLSVIKILSIIKLHFSNRTYLEQNIISSKMMIPSKKEYDIAIAYHAPNTVPVFFVIDKLNAKKKVLWLHGDLETNGGNTKRAFRYYNKFNQVFAVSKNVYQSFVKNCPEMKNKTKLFYNFVDLKGIQTLAKIGPTYHDGFKGIRILTIGRLNEQKGIDIAIQVCSKLISAGYNVRWYVCGDGDDHSQLEKLICDTHLKKHFILLGTQSNPFNYLKNCDLYVQPSRYEGYCTTTNEARMLGKPVITTDVSGAREQFVNDKTGWITNIDVQELFEKIVWCIKHPSEVNRVQDNLKLIIRSDINTKEHPLEELFYVGETY